MGRSVEFAGVSLEPVADGVADAQVVLGFAEGLGGHLETLEGLDLGDDLPRPGLVGEVRLDLNAWDCFLGHIGAPRGLRGPLQPASPPVAAGRQTLRPGVKNWNTAPGAVWRAAALCRSAGRAQAASALRRARRI